jgi:TPR repeat protein
MSDIELYDNIILSSDDIGENFYNLALIYEKGNDEVEMNLSQALILFNKASNNGNINAMLRLAKLYSENKDYVKANKFLNKAIEKNNLEALESLAFNYEKGLGVDIDLNKANEYYKRAKNTSSSNIVKQKIINNDFNTALSYEYGTKNNSLFNFALALEFYKKNLNQKLHYDETVEKIIYFYECGIGTDIDIIKMNKIILDNLQNVNNVLKTKLKLKLAINYEDSPELRLQSNNIYNEIMNENSEASYQLGLNYELGINIDVDLEKAKNLYIKSNTVQAKHRILLQNKNLDEVIIAYIEIINICIESDKNLYYYALGDTYEKKNDYKNAFESFQSAAYKGNIDAMFKLGYYYWSGLTYPQNFINAYEWFNIGSDLGHLDCKYMLSFYYRDGIGIDINYDLYNKLLVDAAESDHIFSIKTLAFNYDNGVYGSDINYEFAHDLYLKAYNLGDREYTVKIINNILSKKVKNQFVDDVFNVMNIESSVRSVDGSINVSSFLNFK